MPEALAMLQGSPKHPRDSPQDRAKQQTWNRMISQAVLCPTAILPLWSSRYMAHLLDQHLEG